MTALGSVLALQFAMLEVGVPLWIVQQTDAPRITVVSTLIVNTVLVIALQVPATRGTEHPVAAARACGRAGLILAASCLVLGLARGIPAGLAALVVLVGVALQAVGEVLSQALHLGAQLRPGRMSAPTAPTRESSTRACPPR